MPKRRRSGNVLTKTNISTSESVEYTWDHRNRLVKVTFKDSGGTPTEIVEYAYDYGQRWVRKTLDTNADQTIEESRVFVHDNGQIVLDFEKAGTGSAGNSDLAHRYLWGPAIDQLLSDETVDDGGAEDVLWTLGDWQGSIRHLASYDESTDTTTIENEKFYDAYGNVTSESNSAVDTIFAYTGRMFDDDTGLQNNLNRWYDPAVGRWVSEDPIGFDAGDPNLYRYVGNGPADSVDPSGLDTLRIRNTMQGEVEWDVAASEQPWYYKAYCGLIGRKSVKQAFVIGTIASGDGSFAKGVHDFVNLDSTNDLDGYAKLVDVSGRYGGGQVPYLELQAAVRRVSLAGLSAQQQRLKIQEIIDSVRRGKYHSDTPATDFLLGATDQFGQAAFDVRYHMSCHEGEVDSEGRTSYGEPPSFRDWREGAFGKGVSNYDGPAYHRGNVVAEAAEYAEAAMGPIRTAERTPGGIRQGRSLESREAIERLRRNEDIYTRAKQDAKKLQKKASGGAVHDDAHGPGFFDHWHGKNRDTGHAFHGDPVE